MTPPRFPDNIVYMNIRKELRNAFDSLSVPEKCRSCPAIGGLVVEYAATDAASRMLGEMCISGEILESLAAKVAVEKEISFEHALEYTATVANIPERSVRHMEDNDSKLGELAGVVSHIISSCEAGVRVQRDSETLVFTCSSNSLG